MGFNSVKRRIQFENVNQTININVEKPWRIWLFERGIKTLLRDNFATKEEAKSWVRDYCGRKELFRDEIRTA